MKGNDLKPKLSRFLFDYGIRPHSTTGIAPSELLMKRQLKTRLHLIKPDVGRKVITMQTRQKTTHDRHANFHIFKIGDLVYALRYHNNTAPSNNKWNPYLIPRVSKVGPPFVVTSTNYKEDWRVTSWYHRWCLYGGWYLRSSRVRLKQSQEKPSNLSSSVVSNKVLLLSHTPQIWRILHLLIQRPSHLVLDAVRVCSSSTAQNGNPRLLYLSEWPV